MVLLLRLSEQKCWMRARYFCFSHCRIARWVLSKYVLNNGRNEESLSKLISPTLKNEIMV